METYKVRVNCIQSCEIIYFSYTLVVEVDDGSKTGTTTIEVSVTSSNDATPSWSTIPSSAISVNENTAIGTSISSVTASDADYGDHGTITYSITTVAGGKNNIL